MVVLQQVPRLGTTSRPSLYLLICNRIQCISAEWLPAQFQHLDRVRSNVKHSLSYRCPFGLRLEVRYICSSIFFLLQKWQYCRACLQGHQLGESRQEDLFTLFMLVWDDADMPIHITTCRLTNSYSQWATSKETTQMSVRSSIPFTIRYMWSKQLDTTLFVIRGAVIQMLCILEQGRRTLSHLSPLHWLTDSPPA